MKQLPAGERIAVTGMAMHNALGTHIDTLWPRTLALDIGIRSMRAAPIPARLATTIGPQFFDAPFIRGRNSYCDALGLCECDITRQDIAIPPQDFRVMSTSTRMTLRNAQQAVQDAGLDTAGYAGDKVGVFVSQNSGECASTLWALQQSVFADRLARLAAAHGGWDAGAEAAFADVLRADAMTPDESSMLCRLNCVAAGMLCHRYGFSGASFSVGAACASGLAALYAALPLLRNGSLDAAVVGGAEELFNPLYLVEFCALGALARPQDAFPHARDYVRPFDAHRTGFVLGEGAATVVLERESTARARGARIYGLITGAGSVTNTHGPIEPSADFQQRATELSFAGLDYGPQDVDLVECHATATVQGDLEEGRALTRLYGRSHGGNGVVLSAYKAQVGHTAGAAGLMALIHGLLALRDKVYPPTANCTDIDPALPLTAEGLRLLSAPEPWPQTADRPRRLQVNAFAFGGLCCAVQVEEDNTRSLGGRSPDTAGTTAPADPVGQQGDFDGEQYVVDGVRCVTLRHQGQPWRLGSTTPLWIHSLAGLPADPGEENMAALNRNGVWLAPAGNPLPVAVMCCGQGNIWPGMGRALYDTFPAARAAMDRIAAAADWDVLALLDEPELDKITLTRWQQPYLFLLEYAQASYLASLGFTPNVMSGHSLGELIALCLAGVYTPEQSWYILDERAKQMAKLEASASHDTCMMAVYADASVIEATLREFPDLLISNYNTPTQFILSGPTAMLQEARRVLRKQKKPAVMLNVSMAFHHPGMRVMREESVRRLHEIPTAPARMPMLSCITTEMYPADTPGIVQHIVDLDENAVRWVENVHKMWNRYGVRHFVEFGPADTLCGLTADIRPEAVCIAAGRKNKEVEGMRAAVARLYALGHLPRRPGTASCSSVTSTVKAPAPQERNAARPASDNRPVPPHVEELMPVIMKATGFTREELAPDMDLRHDLAIRSSRFPVIMHEAEECFGISIRFEDLMGVATIRDLADVLARLRHIQVQDAAPAQTTTRAEDTDDAPPAPPLLRYSPDSTPLVLPPACNSLAAAPVILVGAGALHDHWRQCLLTLGAQVHSYHDAATALAAADSPVTTAQGLVFACPAPRTAADIPDPAPELTAALELLQQVLRHNNAAFCCASEPAAQAPMTDSCAVSPLMAGLGGMLLAVALEYPHAHLRAVSAHPDAPQTWMAQALHPTPAANGAAPLQWRVNADGSAVTPCLRAHPADAAALPLPLRRDDVVVVSGGGRGITPAALEGLAPLGLTLVLLGRSAMTPETTLARLTELGATARYLSCDCTNADDVRRCLREIHTAYGRIDAVIHAAGVNRDATLAEMTREQMQIVIATKCTGLHTLLREALPLGLRCACTFSSLAGWLGNYGQSNYSAANRATAALLERFAAAHRLHCRCLWLPPVMGRAGQGMAAGDDMRRQLQMRGLDKAWIDADELGMLLARECFAAGQTHVVWSRVMPSLPTVADPLPVSLAACHGLAERPSLFGAVYPLELEQKSLPTFHAGRDFSHFADADLATAPRRQGTTLIPEALLAGSLAQAAVMVQPWCTVLGMRDISFAPDGVPCPEGVTRQCRIRLDATPVRVGDTPLGSLATRVWHAEMRAPGLSANGRRLHEDVLLCRAQVCVGCLPESVAGLPPLADTPLPPDADANRTLFYTQEKIAALNKEGYTPVQHWFAVMQDALYAQGHVGSLQHIKALWCLPPRAGSVHVRLGTAVTEASDTTSGVSMCVVHEDGTVLATFQGIIQNSHEKYTVC